MSRNNWCTVYRGGTGYYCRVWPNPTHNVWEAQPHKQNSSQRKKKQKTKTESIFLPTKTTNVTTSSGRRENKRQCLVENIIIFFWLSFAGGGPLAYVWNSHFPHTVSVDLLETLNAPDSATCLNSPASYIYPLTLLSLPPSLSLSLFCNSSFSPLKKKKRSGEKN